MSNKSQLTQTGLNCHFCGIPAVYYGETVTLGTKKVGMCEYHRTVYGCGDIKLLDRFGSKKTG